MAASVKYPIGQQSYEELRSSGSLYVDKTMFIEKIVTSGTRYYFLARPRRFGKSLLLSTMKCFYEGKRDLFKGLYIDNMEWRWEKYPVLYLDLNLQTSNSDNAGSMERIIYSHLENWEREYDISEGDPELSIRFQNIIKAAYRKTGKKIVVLVDEYDKPLLNQINDKKGFTRARELLMGIYSNFKSSADYLELVFLSGVSRFGKLSVFSGLNNLEDISFDNEFSAICGMTEQEVTDNFQIGITELSEQEELTYEETLIKLKTYYDGYRFSQLRLNIYNPYSLLQVMKKRKFMNYWIESGTPTLLVEQLKRFDVKLEKLIGADCFEEELKGLDLDNPRPLALLYQTGYLTIKDYNREYGYYTLGIPNREVSDGFFTFILPYYANLKDEGSKLFVARLAYAFKQGEADEAMRRLQTLFTSVSYEMQGDREVNFQNAMLIVMKVLDFMIVKAEERTSDGRIDLLVITERFCYIIEIKIDKSAEIALEQIDEKKYDLPYRFDGRKIIKIGASFSTKRRTITDWVISTEVANY